MRSRAAGLRWAESRSPTDGRNTSLAPWERARSRPGSAAIRQATRQAARWPANSSRRCSRLGIRTSRAGSSRPVITARSASSAPMSCPASSGRVPADLAAEAGDHLGQPVRRVRMAGAVLGVAMQREIGKHDAEALRQRRHDRLPLAVREAERMQAARARGRCPSPGRRRGRRRGGDRAAAASAGSSSSGSPRGGQERRAPTLRH